MKEGVLSALVTLTATTVIIAIAITIVTVIVTLIGASSNVVSAQVSCKGIFAKSAKIYNLYDKVSASVRVNDCLI